MRFGLPLLITNQVGIHREVAQYRAGLVSECSVNSLTTRLRQLLADQYLRRELGANGRALAEREYTVSRVTTRFLDLYREHSTVPLHHVCS
jgi:glycosyltransferase involved in cell wall biosynthesis